MTEREALKLALEALKQIDEAIPFPVAKLAIMEAEKALAQPEQEPFCYVNVNAQGDVTRTVKRKDAWCKTPLYTAPPQPKEPEQEPVAWATREDFYRELDRSVNRMRRQMEIKGVVMRCANYDVALPVIDIREGHVLVGQVTTPPQRTWVGLTPQERDEINEQVYGAVPHHVAFHHALEAKLKEKNT